MLYISIQKSTRTKYYYRQKLNMKISRVGYFYYSTAQTQWLQ